MALPQVDPLLVDQLIVIISATFMESFSADEQAVIGTFLATLGSVISFNSVYALYINGQNTSQNQQDTSDNQEKDQQNDEFDLLKKSMSKIQEELENIKGKH